MFYYFHVCKIVTSKFYTLFNAHPNIHCYHLSAYSVTTILLTIFPVLSILAAFLVTHLGTMDF